MAGRPALRAARSDADELTVLTDSYVCPIRRRKESYENFRNPEGKGQRRERPRARGGALDRSAPTLDERGSPAFLKNPQPTSRFSRQSRASSFPSRRFQAVPSGLAASAGRSLSGGAIACKSMESGSVNGGGGIRTLVGGISPETVFETARTWLYR